MVSAAALRFNRMLSRIGLSTRAPSGERLGTELSRRQAQRERADDQQPECLDGSDHVCVFYFLIIRRQRR